MTMADMAADSTGEGLDGRLFADANVNTTPSGMTAGTGTATFTADTTLTAATPKKDTATTQPARTATNTTSQQVNSTAAPTAEPTRSDAMPRTGTRRSSVQTSSGSLEATPRLTSSGQQPEAVSQTLRRRGKAHNDSDDREDNAPANSTLQLTDTELVTAQKESKFVKTVVQSGTYRGMEVTVAFDLAVIETSNGRRVLLPPTLWSIVFKEMHGSVWSGHLRGPHTYGRVAQLYWWPRLRREVNQWVRGCPECGSRKARPREVIPPLRSIRGGDVGDRWALDVAGPFPVADGGERFVIAAVEYVTRYAVATCVRNHTAEDIAKFILEEVVLRFGAFRELLTDGAPELTGNVINELMNMAQAKQINPVPYRPQMVGLVERFHRTWKDCVSVFMQDETQKDWNLWVRFATYAYNSARHSTVLLTPNELMMG
ncbi:hypothetical protein DVH05_028598 [Phytophthora capsici]|nr:hypothetical protein DVH05_028598 [Phytophthora capsici]